MGMFEETVKRIISEVSVEHGTATGGTNITLTDTTKSWGVNMWTGSIVEVDIGGIEYHREITGNTADTLTFDPLPGAIVVALGDPYDIRKLTAPSTPIEREVQHNVAGYVTPNDIIAAALAPIYTPCSFRVEAAFSVGGVLSATITRGGNTQTVDFNHSVALIQDAIFRFDLTVLAGDTINYQYGVNTNILVFRVVEVPSAVS
jgi:hypothetical protein